MVVFDYARWKDHLPKFSAGASPSPCVGAGAPSRTRKVKRLTLTELQKDSQESRRLSASGLTCLILATGFKAQFLVGLGQGGLVVALGG